MAFFTQGDLQFTDYDWRVKEEEADSLFINFADDAFLARHKADDMLAFINAVARLNRWRKKESGHKLERIIKTDLPSRLTHRDEAYRWVASNWSNYA